ncbi:MAG: hypothetical protein JW834_02505 [Candidatus Diapherotrites archaeon]|nr:hypothetical protein [Candidatus Diapherotrites archaeon]
MKPFPAVLREHKRYVAFRVHGVLDEQAVKSALSQAVLGLIGESGFADANFSVVGYAGGEGVCRSTDLRLYDVIAALTLVSRIGEQPAWVEVLGVSGTIRKTNLYKHRRV